MTPLSGPPQTLLTPAGMMPTQAALAGLPPLNTALGTPTLTSVAVANGESLMPAFDRPAARQCWQIAQEIVQTSMM